MDKGYKVETNEINKQLKEAINSSEFDYASKMLDLINYSDSINDLSVLTEGSLKEVAKAYSAISKEVLAINSQFVLDVNTNATLAVSKLLAQYSITVESNRLAEIIDVTKVLSDDTSVKVANLNIINNYGLFINDLNVKANDSSDINLLNSIASLNAPLSTKENSNNIERPISLDLLDRQVRLAQEQTRELTKDQGFVDPSIKGRDIGFSDVSR